MEREIILHGHSVIGVLVFVTGLLQILLKKGGTRHIIIGQVYLYAWLILLISGAYLGGTLITIIGLFGFYFTLTGSRIGHLKNKEMTIFEKSIIVIAGIAAISMLYYSISLYLNNQKSFATITLVFGLIFLFTAVEDTAKYILKKPIRKQKYGKSDWYFEHLKRMCISFIAAVTAFTSIQNVFNNNTLNFLVPTIVGVILISIAVKFYKKKLLK